MGDPRMCPLISVLHITGFLLGENFRTQKCKRHNVEGKIFGACQEMDAVERVHFSFTFLVINSFIYYQALD